MSDNNLESRPEPAPVKGGFTPRVEVEAESDGPGFVWTGLWLLLVLSVLACMVVGSLQLLGLPVVWSIGSWGGALLLVTVLFIVVFVAVGVTTSI